MQTTMQYSRVASGVAQTVIKQMVLHASPTAPEFLFNIIVYATDLVRAEVVSCFGKAVNELW